MDVAVYNRVIPNVIPSLVSYVFRSAPRRRIAAQLACVLLAFAMSAQAADWGGPEQELARKIFAVTGPGPIIVSVENRSTLGRRDSEVIQNGLQHELQALGMRLVKNQQAVNPVVISLSENPASYVWVAQTRTSSGESAVVMVAAPRPGNSTTHESVPMSLRKISLWTQDSQILDVAVLEEGAAPARIAVLDADRVSIFRMQAGKWQTEQTLGIVHVRPWPRDLRGRLVPAKDHLLDIFLPGVVCRGIAGAGSAFSINCRESDDPWPLVPWALGGGNLASPPGTPPVTIPAVNAFYASTRNFFTGVLTPAVGKLTTVPKFYSAAFLPHENHLLGLFAGVDNHVHMVDGFSDQVTGLNWGSDLASLKTSCGAGWQVLTTSGEGSVDEVRAYEFPDRDPIAVTASIDFAGAITALGTEQKGDTAIAVVRNRNTGSYEAFRLAISCNQ
jgi:hypothetical protein